MGIKKLSVSLLKYTPAPEEAIAMGAKLCYSPAGLEELKRGVEERAQGAFLARLVDSGHLSPIEHASFTFGVEGVSRSLLAQITRHRIASFSVKSQRYVSEVSAQNEDGVFGYIVPPRIEALGPGAVEVFKEQMKQVQEWYDYWVEKFGNHGESTYEDARFVLPNAAETKLIVTMNARELLHFFSLRCCNRAQWEIRALAIEMLRLVKQAAPVIFRDAGPGCINGPCPEGKMSCGKTGEVREQFKSLNIT